MRIHAAWLQMHSNQFSACRFIHHISIRVLLGSKPIQFLLCGKEFAKKEQHASPNTKRARPSVEISKIRYPLDAILHQMTPLHQGETMI